MWVRIYSPEHHISIPIPLCLGGLVVRLIPESMLAQSRESTPEALRPLLTKPALRVLLRACRRGLKGYKGLELVHAESAGGESVSIRL